MKKFKVKSKDDICEGTVLYAPHSEQYLIIDDFGPEDALYRVFGESQGSWTSYKTFIVAECEVILP